MSPGLCRVRMSSSSAMSMPSSLLRWGTFLAWSVMPLVLTLLFLSEKVPLVVDTLEEGMYLLGVSLTLLVAEALPVGSFRVTATVPAPEAVSEPQPTTSLEPGGAPPADESLT